MHRLMVTHSTEETREFGKELAENIESGTVIAFQGELGAGKTTLIQGVLEALGAPRPFVSPTFVIMKLYNLSLPTSRGIKRIYHADAYRVEEKDFETLGFTEWCADPEGLVLLEWPERIQNILPEKKVEIKIKSLSENERGISIEEEE